MAAPCIYHHLLQPTLAPVSQPEAAPDANKVTSMPCAHQCHHQTMKKKNLAYQLVVTFSHITFGGTAGVLSILTGPLHSQRAVTTEGVDQAG